MVSPDRVKFDMTGDQVLIRRLDKLERKSAKKVLSKSIRAGSAPIRKAAKRDTPVRSGETKRNLITKLKFYRNSGTQVAIIGVRKKSKARFTLHLVEGGTKAHVIQPKNKKALAWDKGDGSGNRIRRYVKHPGIQGKNMLANAARTESGAAAIAFSHKASIEITREATTP